VTNTPPPAGSDPGPGRLLRPGPRSLPSEGHDGPATSGSERHLLFQGTRIGAIIPMLVLGGLVMVLIVEALPAIRYNGWGFFTGSVWEGGNPYGTPTHAGGVYHLPGAKFGAWP
jgi:ABC-type phosphate transport system permease subunit